MKQNILKTQIVRMRLLSELHKTICAQQICAHILGTFSNARI